MSCKINKYMKKKNIPHILVSWTWGFSELANHYMSRCLYVDHIAVIKINLFITFTIKYSKHFMLIRIWLNFIMIIFFEKCLQ